MGKAQGQGQKHRGRRREGKISSTLEKQHSMHAMLKVLLSMAKQLARIMRPCC
jgi:hypothetical protein